jgi:plastocyanin
MALPMKTSVRLGLIALGTALCTASAGTITGIVSARGAQAAEEAQAGGNYQSRRYKFAERVDYARLRDFIVYIDQSVGDPKAAAVGTITQRDVSFDPHVLPIVVGSAIRWPNADDIFHNVFSMSDVCAFDLGTYTKEKVPLVVFNRVGRVDVFCSIHSTMHCIILVLPSRYFAKADANHRYSIDGVPAGTYMLRAWQERMPSLAQSVVVPRDGSVQVDFTLGLADLPKY